MVGDGRSVFGGLECRVVSWWFLSLGVGLGVYVRFRAFWAVYLTEEGPGLGYWARVCSIINAGISVDDMELTISTAKKSRLDKPSRDGPGDITHHTTFQL